ncbi:MAG: sulfatase-like hydrolase/transferase, partial [Solirubrobacteraceae bacterium]
QQTCMFSTQGGPNYPSLQPYNQAGDTAHGFPTIGDVLSQGLQNCGTTNTTPYNTAWIGKWHLSDWDFSGTGVGQNGPADYGFSNPYCLPTNSSSSPFPHLYPSPNGLDNEGTAGNTLGNSSGTWSMRSSFVYNTMVDPSSIIDNALAISIPTEPTNQLNDPAIYHAFRSYWLAYPPTGGPWFLAVSFINPHDIGGFPWSYGLASTGYGCGPTDTFGCASGSANAGYYPPPKLGWNDTGSHSGELIQFNGLAYASIYNSSSPIPTDWNWPDDPNVQPYNCTGTSFGKPDFQSYYEEGFINTSHGTINSEDGWQQFLNYYYWMHSAVDALVGLVITEVESMSGNPPVVIFASDHGEYGGSHSIHGKEGPLYDEVVNVPLLIRWPGQEAPVSRDFVCSSVDILPFIYALALGNERSWRTDSSDIIAYLSGRESILDAIHSSTATQRRLAPYTNAGGPGASGGLLPYVLHTCDEFIKASALPCGVEAFPPTHIIGFRTVDNTVCVSEQATGNFYGGGKLCMYDNWQPCSTYPNTAAPIEFEYYDYYRGNYGEEGNNAFDGLSWNADGAGVYLNSYNSIMADELYNFAGITGAHANAFAAYETYLNNSCSGFSGTLGAIPTP